MVRLLLLFVSTMVVVDNGYSQQHTGASKYDEEIDHNKLSMTFSSTLIPQASLDGSGADLVVPNLGINYEYWFDEHFAIGSYNNIITVTYVVNSDKYQSYERKHPVVLSAVGIFRPWKNLNLFLGPGIEIDNNGSLFVGRFGFDYGIRIGRSGWFFTPRFIYDFLGADYGAYSLGLDIGKWF